MSQVKGYRRGTSFVKAYQRAAREVSVARYGTKELVSAQRKMTAAGNKLKTKYNLGLRRGHSYNPGGFLGKLKRKAT